MIEVSYECIPLTKKVINDVKPQKPRKLPGWNENVLPKKQESLFWHSVWLSKGKPTSGGLYQMMKQTRLQYHYAVKVAKREANRLESEALGAAADAGDQQIFKELKKHLADKRSCGQPFPDSLEGKVTEEDIVDKYRECYSALYNSAPSDMQSVKQHIEELIRCNIHSSLAEVNRITPAIVKEASTMIKCGKNDVSGEYTSDVFKFAPDLLFEHLAEVFKSCAIVLYMEVSPSSGCPVHSYPCTKVD